jgi:microcystin-dependent protein
MKKQNGFIPIIVAIAILVMGSVAIYEYSQNLKENINTNINNVNANINDINNKVENLGGSLVSTRYGGTGTNTVAWSGLLRLTSGTWATTTLVDADVPDNLTINGITNSSFIVATTTNTTVGLIPAGTILAYATATAPTGWLLCDGSSKATSSYPNLFAILGYTYGGAGANFTIPDLRGKQIIGYGSSTPAYGTTTPSVDTMGKTGGEQSHTQTVTEMPNHTHDAAGVGASADATAGTLKYAVSASTTATGGGQPFNVLDPYMVLNYIIKY